MPNPAVLHTTQANTLSVTIPATTAGSCLVVCVDSLNTTGAASITGITLGGSADNFASAKAAHEATGGVFNDAFIWIDPNCAAGQTAIVISGSNLDVVAGNGEVTIYEVSNLAPSSLIDQTSAGNGDSHTYDSGTTGTTVAAVEFWVGTASVNATSANFSVPAGWTNVQNNEAVSGYQITSSTGTADYSAAIVPFTTWAACVVTLKAIVSVSPPTATITVVANPVTPSRLIAAMANSAGKDAGGNAYAAGFTGQIVAFHPGASPTTVEAWQNVTPPSGWSGTLRYKLLAESKFAAIDFDLTHSGASSPVSLMTVAGAYAPAADHYRPMFTSDSGTDEVADVHIATSGAVTAENWSGSATRIGATIVYPLD